MNLVLRNNCPISRLVSYGIRLTLRAKCEIMSCISRASEMAKNAPGKHYRNGITLMDAIKTSTPKRRRSRGSLRLVGEMMSNVLDAILTEFAGAIRTTLPLGSSAIPAAATSRLKQALLCRIPIFH